MAALGGQVDQVDPDWAIAFFHDGSAVGTQLVAKNAQAATRSPITLNLTAVFGAEEDELRKTVERSFGFGTAGRIELPPENVEKFVINGPEFIADERESVAVSWSPEQGQGQDRQLVISFLGDNGRPIASFLGQTEHVGTGHQGASIQATFFNAARTEFLLPFSKAGTPVLSIDFEASGHEPAAVARAATLLNYLGGTLPVRLEVDGNVVATLHREEPARVDDHSLTSLRILAEDLAFVQSQTNQFFNFPADATAEDALDVHCLRLLLDNKRIVLPGLNQLDPVLNGSDSPRIRQMLGSETMTIKVENETFGYHVFGHDLMVGPTTIYAPKIVAVNGDEAVKAPDGGTGEGFKVKLRTAEGHGLWAFRTEAFTGDQRIRPVGLGLPGCEDAEDVARAALAPSFETES